MANTDKIDTVKKIENIAISLGNDVHQLSKPVIENPKFAIWSGSSKPHQHHYGNCGLALHTLEVIKLAKNIAEYYPEYQINEKVLFLACLFHDIGKVYDYAPMHINSNGTPINNCVWDSTEHKRLIHHISRSALLWSRTVSNYNNDICYNEYHDKVLHAILSHHGMREAGSPVAPKTREAWLLHLCDGISARLYDADTLDIISRKNI